METIENNAMMSKCPSFDGCSAPLCPLDKFIGQRTRLTKEPKCISTKRTRFNIGKDLPNLGLSAQELQGYISIHGSIESTKLALLSKFAYRAGK